VNWQSSFFFLLVRYPRLKRENTRWFVLCCATIAIAALSSGFSDAQTRAATNARQQEAPRLDGTSPGIKTDRRVYPEPAPPRLPPAGATFEDPVFGTTLLRVTDERDGAFNATNYSYYPSFNKDNTRLFIVAGGSPTLFAFDAENFRISNKRPLFATRPPRGQGLNGEDAIWSGTSPEIIFGHDGLKLWAYNVATQTYALLKDFSSELEPGEIFQMSRSIDDNVFAFTRKDAKGKTLGYGVWRRDKDDLFKVDASSEMDEVQVDKTGKFLVVKTGFSGGGVVRVQVVTLATRSVENLIDGPPDYAPGHSDNGSGIIIGGDNWKNRFTFRKLAEPHRFYPVIEMGNDWTIGSHVSMLADDESWILMSTFLANDLPSSRLFRDELLLIATDGSKRVRRLAHIHSVYREYWDQPRANISRDGKFAAFTSNWGQQARRDVFILRIPSMGKEEIKMPAPVTGTSSTSSNPRSSSEGESVSWINLVNCTASGGTLTRGSGSSTDGSASSVQVIRDGDGFVEFTALDMLGTRLCGLTGGSAESASMDFAIRLTANGVAEIREANNYAGETTYRAGDVFRVAVEGKEVKYYKNSVLFFTSLNRPSYPLRACAVLMTPAARIGNVHIQVEKK
jgi:hypothetical protein